MKVKIEFQTDSMSASEELIDELRKTYNVKKLKTYNVTKFSIVSEK